MNSQIKIIIVDDHKMFREGISFLLSKFEKIKVIAQASDGAFFLDLLEKSKPDLVLMDINMPNIDGVEATKKALEKYPDLKIIALSMNGDEAFYYKMINAGVSGFVLKKSGSDELEEAIHTVMSGNDYFSQELLKNVIINIGKQKQDESNSKDQFPELSEREIEVLKHICNGFVNKEIAEKLSVSPRTIENYRTKLIEKTGAKNTSNLIMIAIKNKLINI